MGAGVMLLVFRPFAVGDLIHAAEQYGRVSEIGMFETILLSLDNKTVIVPNSQISIVTNLTTEDIIRVDVALKISHSASLRQAKEVLLRVAQECPMVLPGRAPQVLVSDTNELGRDLIIRAYVRSADYIPAPCLPWMRQVSLSHPCRCSIRIQRRRRCNVPCEADMLAKKRGVGQCLVLLGLGPPQQKKRKRLTNENHLESPHKRGLSCIFGNSVAMSDICFQCKPKAGRKITGNQCLNRAQRLGA